MYTTFWQKVFVTQLSSNAGIPVWRIECVTTTDPCFMSDVSHKIRRNNLLVALQWFTTDKTLLPFKLTSFFSSLSSPLLSRSMSRPTFLSTLSVPRCCSVKWCHHINKTNFKYTYLFTYNAAKYTQTKRHNLTTVPSGVGFFPNTLNILTA